MLKIGVIAVFIALSVPVMGQDTDEKSAINAIKTGDMALLKSYLEKHPDVNAEFNSGKTGLYYAIRYNQPRIARLFIEYGAEVNKADEKQNTPLIYAAELNNLEMCKILIDRGANPLHTNLKGKSASDYAFHYGESLAYKYLKSMEQQYKNQDSIPSMTDGPYIYYEAEDQVVLTYFERDQNKNLTRLFEKTIAIGPSDTIVKGIGWDKHSYYIKKAYSADTDDVKTAGDIFVIGDIHGKYNALVNLMINNKIIDSGLKWIFGEGQLVLLGDVFDRGGYVTEVLWFLYDLEIQAEHSGGKVHLLLGNHEIMALTGDHRYINEKYNYFTQFTRTDYYQLYEKNTVLGRWLRTQNVIVRINDYLFLHAGISPGFAALDYTYSDVNARVQKYLNAGQKEADGSPEDFILGPIGPQWYRGYYNTNTNINDNDSSGVQEVTQEFVDNYLRSKGLKRMIIGHNEQLEINTSFEGKIINADVAIEEDEKSAQGLLISADEIFRCFSDGRRELIE